MPILSMVEGDCFFVRLDFENMLEKESKIREFMVTNVYVKEM